MATRKPSAKSQAREDPPAAGATGAAAEPFGSLLDGNESDDGGASRGYTVLARRYRSRGFEEIVGQEPIARTLRNAIAQSRVAHAYLFCGTRGVGKTSMARIFAAALNVGDQAEADAIRAAILRGQDMDVIEIDGASNRGIDDARDLIAAAGIAPARSPYKIYIIDEVHMLTTPAFNALLKTMEEPPAHVKFILCTTEPHKVPATIQSRCQRFDFRSIPAPQIVEHLRAIFAKESIRADDDVVRLIARQANGSMRDALSLADRLIAASEGDLTRTLAEEILGLPDEARVATLVDAILDGDAAAALDRAAALLEQGVSVERALELLADRCRTLMLAKVCGAESPLVELGAEARAQAAAQAAKAEAETFVHHIAICDAAARHARGASTPRTILDATIARLALSDRFVPIREAIRDEARSATTGRSAPALAGAANASRSSNADARAVPPPRATAAPASPSAPSRAAATAGSDVPASDAQKKNLPGNAADAAAARDALIRNPTVRRAIELFDASLVRVERSPRAAGAVSAPAPEASEEAHPTS